MFQVCWGVMLLSVMESVWLKYGAILSSTRGEKGNASTVHRSRCDAAPPRAPSLSPALPLPRLAQTELRGRLPRLGGDARGFRSHGLQTERASFSGPPSAALDGRAGARVRDHIGLARVRAGSAAGVEGEGDRQRGDEARPRKGRAGVRWGGGQRRGRQRTARRVTARAGRIAVGEETPPASARCTRRGPGIGWHVEGME